MAVQVAGACYGTVAEAVTAFYSRSPAAFDSAGDLHLAEQSGGVWYLREYTGGVLVAEVVAPVPAFADCGLADAVADAAAISWAVIGVWAAAWAINALRRAL